MLDNMTVWVLWARIGILRIARYPLFGDHQLSMRYTCWSNLETSSLKLVLGVYLTKVLPLGSFAVTGRSGLFVSSLLSSNGDLQDDAKLVPKCIGTGWELRIRRIDSARD